MRTTRRFPDRLVTVMVPAVLLMLPLLNNTTSAADGCPTPSFASPVISGAGANSYPVAVGDFNGDSKADMVVTSAGSTNVSVMLGNGDGGFQPAVDYKVGF